jgi:cobyrinic acid a,c-diamide synthase
MVGALPGNGSKTDHLVRFGYTELTAERDTMLLRAGEQTRAHEFHYWDSDANGEDLAAKKLSTGRTWRCGFANEHLYAAFPHLYFAGDEKLARRFAEAAACYSENKRKKEN